MGVFEIIIPVFGGMGLFLYGMNLMGSSLQKAAGAKLKRWLEILTTNRLMGVIVGAVVTLVIQSSAATTVMVIGFVNAGLMTLTQAVGIIMGANIGTTITGQLIAFKLDAIAPIFVFIGVIFWIASSSKKGKNIAEIVIGMGLLFVGMGMMGGGLKPLNNSPVFVDMLTKLNNPLLGMLAGFAITAMLQSSSASLGLLQALAGQGLIGLNLSFPILCGQNIGSTTTGLISSVGANKTAKRAALIHFLFNVVGSILFMLLLAKPIEMVVMKWTPDDPMRQIANAHTLFNVVNVVALFPFATMLVKLSEKIISGPDKIDRKVSKYLDERFLEDSSIALDQVNRELLHMSELVLDNMDKCRRMLTESKPELFDDIEDVEERINKLNREMTEYIVKIGHSVLSDKEQGLINLYLYCINDIERMGDHAENIAELLLQKESNSLKFSDKGYEDALKMMDKACVVITESVRGVVEGDEDSARSARKHEKEFDEMEKILRKEHIDRLNKGECAPEQGIIFLDVLSNLERISDHGDNLAKYVLAKFLQ